MGNPYEILWSIVSLTNGVLQMSKGLEMRYDQHKPVGQRVVLLTLNGKPIVTLTYRVAA
jgi:hypothetical protein